MVTGSGSEGAQTALQEVYNKVSQHHMSVGVSVSLSVCHSLQSMSLSEAEEQLITILKHNETP